MNFVNPVCLGSKLSFVKSQVIPVLSKIISDQKSKTLYTVKWIKSIKMISDYVTLSVPTSIGLNISPLQA